MTPSRAMQEPYRNKPPKDRTAGHHPEIPPVKGGLDTWVKQKGIVGAERSTPFPARHHPSLGIAVKTPGGNIAADEDERTDATNYLASQCGDGFDERHGDGKIATLRREFSDGGRKLYQSKVSSVQLNGRFQPIKT